MNFEQRSSHSVERRSPSRIPNLSFQDGLRALAKTLQTSERVTSKLEASLEGIFNSVALEVGWHVADSIQRGEMTLEDTALALEQQVQEEVPGRAWVTAHRSTPVSDTPWSTHGEL